MTWNPLDVIVEIEAPQELNNSSYVLAGLFDLEHAGIVREVRLMPSLNLHCGEIHVGPAGEIRRSEFRAYHTTFFTVRTNRRRVRVALDFRDATFVFPEDGLLHADVLFKRSFDDAMVHAIRQRYSVPIQPAGLFLVARSQYEREEMFLVINCFATTMRNGTCFDRSLLPRWAREFRKARDHVSLFLTQHPLTSQLSRSRADASRRTVFFQTRTFNRTDDADINEVHASRAALIRALRSEFGDQFLGGFVPDQLSRSQYSDCLSSVPADKATYLAAMRSAAVVVYSRGLLDSAALKLAEYLALGKCIVAERVAGRLPVPVRDGHTIAEFRTVEECVAKCRHLLNAPLERARMEDAARAYYDDSVDPAAGMYRMLDTALRIANGAP